ncbi:MAG: hypothetical protein IJ608_05900 [Lachnospiraceae bacterium]|nr:hypothetical protein [Lachnospiraceae bacterium]
MKNRRKGKFTGLFIIPAAFLLSVFIVFKTASPVTKSTLIAAPETGYSDELYKGDILNGSFVCEYGHLDSVEIGLKYDENAANIEDTAVEIHITNKALNDEELLDITLPLNAFPNDEFIKLSVDCDNLKGSLINIGISNGSEPADSLPFSVLIAENADYLSDSAYRYSLNGAEKNGLLALRINYTDGYSLYMPLTYGFFTVLTGISAAAILNKRRNK